MSHRHVLIAMLIVMLTSSPLLAQKRAHAPTPAVPKESDTTQSTQENKGQDSGPSLQETTDWLKKRNFKNTGIRWTSGKSSTGKDLGGMATTGAGDLIFDGCSLKMVTKFSGFSTFDLYSVELSDLDPQSITVETEEFFAEVRLRTTAGRYLINIRTINDKSKEIINSKDYDNMFFIVEDKEMGDRVAKAFSHAITLCKEKEPF